MHIVVTGASGFIGSHLVPFLTAGGHRVTRMVRRQPGAGEARWDPTRGDLDPAVLRGVDAVVNLSGELISRGWTSAQRRRIRDSRVDSTRLLAETVADMPVDRRPRVLVSASGSNFYGDRGDEAITEDSGPGVGFMAEVCKAWEAAADAARDAGVRVVHLRTGIVVAAQGGAFGRLLPLAKLGLLGKFGSGRQYWPWISVDDVVGLYAFAVTREEVAGPLNGSAPNPVTNAELTRTLTAVLHRPMFPVPVPRLAPSIVLGPRLAGDLLFSSIRLLPAKALELGYDFRHPSLEPALRALLKR